MLSWVWRIWPLSPSERPVGDRVARPTSFWHAANAERAGARRRFAINLVVALGATFAACLVLEAVLAVAKINSPFAYVFDREKGISFAAGGYYVQSKEGFSEGYFNSHGFRDAERAWTKPANTFRILVLGDSYVEAFQVLRERSFAALLEAELNAASRGRRFEVLALGQSGFGTADEYMRYLNDGVRYSPDMVVVAFLTGNDLSDNSKILHREKLGFYFVFDEHGELVLDRSTLDRYMDQVTPLDRAFRVIKRHSYLASLISERSFLLREGLRERRFKQTHASANARATGLDEFSDLNVYLPDPTPRWKDAWDITERLLLKFAREVESRGASFMLVSLSNAEQVHPELQRQLTRQYGLPFDFERPDRRLQQFTAAHGIRYLALMPALRDYHRRTGTYLHGFGSVITGHWNEAGHRQAAEQIFAFLKQRNLVPLD